MTFMLTKLARLASDLVGLIYPTKCLICDGWQSSARTPLLCENCLLAISARPLPNIPILVNSDFPPTEISETQDHGVDEVYAGWHYDTTMQQVIHAMKYRRRPSLIQVFGTMLGQRLNEFLRDEIAHAMLIPVPLHRRRERERGFNQSLLLAKALAKVWNLSVLPRALRRVRFTQSQATLGAAKRWENVAGAFAPVADLYLEQHTIFLIDDVFTTGATMKACAEALKSAGAGKMIGIALAKAGKSV